METADRPKGKSLEMLDSLPEVVMECWIAWSGNSPGVMHSLGLGIVVSLVVCIVWGGD
jgi:hypothetical protein